MKKNKQEKETRLKYSGMISVFFLQNYVIEFQHKMYRTTACLLDTIFFNKTISHIIIYTCSCFDQKGTVIEKPFETGVYFFLSRLKI